MRGLRRLPWVEEGERPAYVTTGNGTMNRLADVEEAQIITTARSDVARASALADDPAVSIAELRLAIRYLSRAVREVVMVAELRKERLPVSADTEDDADTAMYGPASAST